MLVTQCGCIRRLPIKTSKTTCYNYQPLSRHPIDLSTTLISQHNSVTTRSAKAFDLSSITTTSRGLGNVLQRLEDVCGFCICTSCWHGNGNGKASGGGVANRARNTLPKCPVAGCGRRHRGGQAKCWVAHPELNPVTDQGTTPKRGRCGRRGRGRGRGGTPRNTPAAQDDRAATGDRAAEGDWATNGDCTATSDWSSIVAALPDPTAQPDTTPFPFLKLPQEIQDQIYKESTTTTTRATKSQQHTPTTKAPTTSSAPPTTTHPTTK